VRRGPECVDDLLDGKKERKKNYEGKKASFSGKRRTAKGKLATG